MHWAGGCARRVLAAQDYALIMGTPGAGKTSAIVAAVRGLLQRGRSVLLTSYTNRCAKSKFPGGYSGIWMKQLGPTTWALPLHEHHGVGFHGCRTKKG